MDWQKAQSSDDSIRFMIDSLIEGQRLTAAYAEGQNVDKRYLLAWDSYKFKDCFLYRTASIGGESLE